MGHHVAADNRRPRGTLDGADVTEDERLNAIRREYEAGRIDASAYITAGGDPDIVQETEAARAADKAAKDEDAHKSASKMVLGCLLVPVVLLGGCWSLSALGGSKGATPESERHGVTATCEKAVRQQLKDPDSAKFDWEGVTPTTSTDALFRYEGSGVVRAANSFGGTASHEFACIGTYTVSTGEARATAVLS